MTLRASHAELCRAVEKVHFFLSPIGLENVNLVCLCFWRSYRRLRNCVVVLWCSYAGACVYLQPTGSAHHARKVGPDQCMQNFCTAVLTQHTVCMCIVNMSTLPFTSKLHVDRVSQVWMWQHRGHIQSDNNRRMLGGCFWVPALLLSRVGAICMQAAGFAAVLQQCSTEGLHSNNPGKQKLADLQCISLYRDYHCRLLHILAAVG